MEKRIRSWATQLNNVHRRLKESDGRRIARRHAREELDRLLAKIRRELHKEFPNFSKDGDPVIHEIPLPAGQKSCPLCGNYAGTFRKLADHILDHHGEKCPCGYQPKGVSESIKAGGKVRSGLKWVASRYGGSQMTGHLRAVQEDLKTHCLMGAIAGFGQNAAPATVTKV
jgi:hypothetical protein